jgi:hypothetical protein
MAGMARKGSRKSRHARRKTKPISSSKPGANRVKRSRRSASQVSERLRTFEAANLYRQGKARSVSSAAHMARTNLKALWRWIPDAIKKDPQSGRLRIKASDRYSERVEILTDTGALVATARGSRQRQLAGQHRATYLDIVHNRKPASALEEFHGKKVGGHELLSDYERLRTLAKAGVLGQLDTLYVSAGGGR